MRRISVIFIFLFFTQIAFGECLQVKAAFDIGSGTTKLKVAEVDVCKHKIKKYLYEKNVAVPYKEALKSSHNFSEEIIKQGLKVMDQLKQEAQKFKPINYSAVATSAFRKAKNSNDFVKRIKAVTGINVIVIDQELEAKLGFTAALSQTDASIENIVVWDIGGGSMQITSYLGNDKFDIYQGSTASVSFKDLIIERVQGKKAISENTPNPIAQRESIKAMAQGRDIALATIPDTLKNKIAKTDVKIIGIGGVHFYSVYPQTQNQNHQYNFFDVANTLSKNINKSDKEIGGEYAPTQVSNLILVLGYMSALGIDKVSVANINMADGLLVAKDNFLKR